MKLKLLFTGKTEDGYLKEGIDIYTKRLRHYIPYEIKIAGERKKKSFQQSAKISAEYEKLMSAFDKTAYIVLLDEKGEKLTSEGFAGLIEKNMNHGYRELVFITGGPYGFPENIRNKADRIVSLSDMTFSHQMVRLILVEQIYRAMTIIRGEPYHHQ